MAMTLNRAFAVSDPKLAQDYLKGVPAEHIRAGTTPEMLKQVWLQSVNWQARFITWEAFYKFFKKIMRDFKNNHTIQTWDVQNISSHVFEELMESSAATPYTGRTSTPASGSGKQAAYNPPRACTWLNGKQGVCKMRATCKMMHKCSVCGSSKHGRAKCHMAKHVE